MQAHQTRTFKHYVQLTSSGQVTFTVQVASIAIAGTQSHPVISASAPWGSQLILVSPHIPSDRQLSVKQQKTQLVVSVPPAINGQLVGKIAIVCPGGGGREEGLGQPLGTTVVLKPSDAACGLGNTLLSVPPVWWAYIVGAPGYPLYFGKVNGS